MCSRSTHGGSHAVWFVLPKKKKKGGEEEGRFYALCGAPMFIKHAGVQGRGAPERRAAARSARAPRSAAQRRAERRAVRYCSGAERRSAAQALSAVRRNGTQSAQSVASGTGELPIIEPVIESCIRTPGAQPERPTSNRSSISITVIRTWGLT